MSEEQGAISLIKPNYSELSLFMMGICFAILFILDSDLRTDFQVLTAPENMDPRLPLLLVLFGQGLVFSIIHLFINSPKNLYEKVCMVFFAVVMNAASGLFATMHLLKHGEFALLAFLPLLNIVSCLFPIILFIYSYNTGNGFDLFDDMIEDDESSAPKLVAGLLLAGICITFGYSIFRLHWSLTFSMCIAYCSYFEQAVHWLAEKRRVS